MGVVRKIQNPAVLAGAADVLSDQLRNQILQLAGLMEPHAAELERKFLASLPKDRFDHRQRTALSAITLGAASRILAEAAANGGGAAAPERGLPAFVEHIAYHGRRLAKLNLPPSAILGALEQYDRLVNPLIEKLRPHEQADLRWARDQLHFSVVLTLNNAYYQVREWETQAFYELSRAELESKTLDELLERFLEILARFCRADEASLFLENEDATAWMERAWASRTAPPRSARTRRQEIGIARIKGMLRQIARPRCTPLKSPGDLLVQSGWNRRFATCWTVPLVTGDRIAGIMQFGFAKPYEWLPREQELLAAAAERCLIVAEKARLVEDLAAQQAQVRKLAEHMLHVEEAERRRVSRELHDEAGQSLVCVRLKMEMIESQLPVEPRDLRAGLREARESIENTIVEIRRLISALSPAVLEQLGFAAAVRQLVNRFRQVHGARVRLKLHPIGHPPQRIESILYRLVQECMSNIAKHSFANTVNISLSCVDGILKLAVEDDGIGFDVEEAMARRDAFGLAGMSERVALLGGQFEVSSRTARGCRAVSTRRGAARRTGKGKPGGAAAQGTSIVIHLPIAQEDAGSETGGKGEVSGELTTATRVTGDSSTGDKRKRQGRIKQHFSEFSLERRAAVPAPAGG